MSRQENSAALKKSIILQISLTISTSTEMLTPPFEYRLSPQLITHNDKVQLNGHLNGYAA